jgi:Cu-Zn family superoxide dismutase
MQAAALLQTQSGDTVGTVSFTQQEGKVVVRADVTNLPPGFHGFHVHSNGVCDPSTGFMSAGGHMDLGMGDDMSSVMEMGHAGDMTNLYVNGDGTGSLTLVLDRFTVDDLLVEGGRAVMVHAAADNFRNIPSRYGVEPDQMTLDTGDAGARIACGVILSLPG